MGVDREPAEELLPESESVATMIRTDEQPGPLGGVPALLVIDPQRDFLEPDGAVFCPATSVDGIEEVIANVNRVVGAARAADVPVVWSKELHRPDHADSGLERLADPDHTVDRTAGAEFAPAVDVDEGNLRPAEYVVEKRRYNLFFNTDLEHLLATYGVDTVLLVGVTTDVCVHYTAQGAHERDYLYRVVEECTAATDQAVHEAALRLCGDRLPAGVQSIEAVLSALDQYDGNPVVRRVKETGTVA